VEILKRSVWQNRMSEYMPSRMPDGVSEYMPNRVPDGMSEYMPDRVSVDGDHSKKVICKFLVSDMWLKPTRHPCEQIWQIPPRFLEMFGVAWKLSLFGIA